MNLEQLRKQAKKLAQAARNGDRAALDRLGELPVEFASAQFVVAREHGFPSWAAAVRKLEANVESFIHAATSSRHDRACQLLEARPEIAADRWARLVLGIEWTDDPNEVGGPRDWAPLHYVCHSSFAGFGLASELLARGADPNAYFANEHGEMSALFGAAGVLRDPELTALLLKNGADPNGEPTFGDALYHSVEAQDPACLRTLLEHGAEPKGSAALGHALDYDHPVHVRLLLQAGSDVGGEHIVHAVRRGRDIECIRLLAAQPTVDLDYRGGEWSTPPEQYRTAYQNAVLRGRDDIAALLEELGASTELKPGDGEVAAIARGERPAHPLPAELDPDQQEIVCLAALDGHLELVVELLGPNFFGHVGGGPPGSLLHHACWVGKPELVRRLLELGADPTMKPERSGRPIAWTAVASQYHHLRGRDYVAVAELLVAAGAEVEEAHLETADGPLLAWLEERI